MNIAIGALGGSGTRAVAQVFIEAGTHLGDDLNQPNDNLVFTRLFKNPYWYQKSNTNDIYNRLDAFRNYSEGTKISLPNAIELVRGAYNNKIYPTNDREFFTRIIKRFFGKKAIHSEGWKEPNTQIYLPEILNKWPNLKYIHVIRHGLDMAFSKNTQQLAHWGWKYNLHPTKQASDSEIAVMQLKYWIATTKEVLTLQNKHPQNIFILNHSDFCNSPLLQIKQLLDFCDLPHSQDQLQNLARIPKNTGSNNRYKNEDISIFDRKDIDFITQIGFKI